MRDQPSKWIFSNFLSFRSFQPHISKPSFLIFHQFWKLIYILIRSLCILQIEPNKYFFLDLQLLASWTTMGRFSGKTMEKSDSALRHKSTIRCVKFGSAATTTLTNKGPFPNQDNSHKTQKNHLFTETEEYITIYQAIRILNFMTCIKFVPWDGKAKDYLLIWPVKYPSG